MKTKHLPRLAVCAAILIPALPIAARAQQNAAPASQAAPSVWQKRVLKDDQDKLPAGLPYRLFVPKNYDASKKYPLVVFLHGSGERGTDNEAQIAKNGPPKLVSDEVQNAQPCIVVAPQCPPELRWASYDWRIPPTAMVRVKEQPSEPMRLLLQLLDALPREFSLDPQRMYLTGISMGGMGTWELLTRRPQMFAAAVPICGRADLTTAPLINKIPIWDFHGDADTSVSVEHSRAMVGALKIFDSPVRYTEYAGVGHNSWDKAYDEPELFPWLFAQRRR